MVGMVLPNWAGATGAGQQLGANAFALRRQNEIANMYKTQGPGILAGDPNAMNAFARVDTPGALAAQTQQQSMAISRERLQMARAAAQRAASSEARSVSAAQAKQAAAALQNVIGMAQAANSPEEYNAIVTQAGLDPNRYNWESKDVNLAEAFGAMDAYKLRAAERDAAAGPDPMDVLDQQKRQLEIAKMQSELAAGPSTKPSAAEAKLARIMETIDPNTGAPFSRNDAIKIMDLYSVAPDGQLIDRRTGSLVRPDSAQQPVASMEQPGITDFGNPNLAVGPTGIGLGVANIAMDMVGLPFASQNAAQAKVSMSNLATDTMLVLSADFPGRPSNLTREKIESMTIQPNELFQGGQGVALKVKAMRKMVGDALVRADAIATSSSGYTATQRSEAKAAFDRLVPLVNSYKNLEDALQNGGQRQGVGGSTSDGLKWRIIE
jgi:hypothetical protein